ncbi:hypothetical protein DFJ74DRAFT_357883 [Hyaloraphidium curvatum]|nr:hypothetical protein DFJ74DRAFT_357883 [Hyaloraphidium curvatum]
MTSLKSKYDVAGKVIVVTGGASGFGADLARKLAKRSPKSLVLVDVQEELGKGVAAELSKQGCSAHFRKVDLSKMDEVKEMVLGTVRDFGGLDVLVNNAGIGDDSWPRSVDNLDTSVSPDAAVRMTMINYHAVVYATELAIIEAKKRGTKLVVVNTASMAGLIPQKEPIYASGKAAVIHFTRCLGDLAPAVRVNVVLPNAAPTPIFLRGLGSDFAKMMEKHMVTIDAVTEAMVRAIEDESMAGQTIRVVPRGTDVYDHRTGKTTAIAQWGKL